MNTKWFVCVTPVKNLCYFFHRYEESAANPHTREKWYKILIHVKNLLILSGIERIAKYSSHLWPGFYCASCKARLTHRDHDSGGGVVVIRGVTLFFLFPIENSWRDASISIKLYKRVRYHKIQVKFDKGVIRKMLTDLWPFLTYILAKLSIWNKRSFANFLLRYGHLLT